MNGRPVAYHPEAETELLAAVAWYDEQRTGLGLELLTELRLVEIAIGEHSMTFPPAHDAPDTDVRQALVHRFPYRMVFFESRGELVVVAVAHTSRNPGYWRRRLPS